MSHTISLKQKAISLRVKGYSYSYISSKTGLSKSTLSGWLAAIPYVPNAETVKKIGKALAAASRKISEKKQQTFLLAQEEAIREIGSVSQRDLFMFGLGLYLGEGSKTHDIVRIVNSDPRVIRLAIIWFESLGLTKKNFAITLHLYPDSDERKSMEYWAACIRVSKDQFLKTQIDWRKDKKAYKLGKLPYGTVHLGVRGMGEKKYGVFFSRKILACIDEVAKNIEMRD